METPNSSVTLAMLLLTMALSLMKMANSTLTTALETITMAMLKLTMPISYYMVKRSGTKRGYTIVNDGLIF